MNVKPKVWGINEWLNKCEGKVWGINEWLVEWEGKIWGINEWLVKCEGKYEELTNDWLNGKAKE